MMPVDATILSGPSLRAGASGSAVSGSKRESEALEASGVDWAAAEAPSAMVSKRANRNVERDRAFLPERARFPNIGSACSTLRMSERIRQTAARFAPAMRSKTVLYMRQRVNKEISRPGGNQGKPRRLPGGGRR